MTDIEIYHKLDIETVKKLNEVLKPTGYSVGKLFYEFSMLESDVKRAGTQAYYSEPEDVEKNYALKRELEKKRDEIMVER